MTGISPGLPRRLGRYLAERFPLAQFVPLISLFTFSSAAYSRLARGAPGFAPWPTFAVGAVTAIVLFFLLRVLDEHKDEDIDRRYRPELPVPRGLITLAELRVVAWVAAITALALNALVAPRMLLLLVPALVWATGMTKEFFVRDWLRDHPTAYLLSHMAIMPLIDLYTTGLDWFAERSRAPHALVLFLAVTFWNGILIEVGRKIRAPGEEREGVVTYTAAWGLGRAPAIWIFVLALSAVTACVAARATTTATITTPLLILLAAGCAVPAVRFLRSPERGRAIEIASGVWPFVTYLTLGSVPWLFHALGSR